MPRTDKSAEDAELEAKSDGPAPGQPEDGRLQKVQELLFGPRSRELQAETAQLAVHVDRTAAALQKDAAEWRETVMTHVGNEVAEIKKLIRREQKARTDAVQASLDQLEQTRTSLEERVEALDAASRRADEETRDGLQATTADLRAEIERARDELASATERVSRDLDHDKADRTALSGLFEHVAEQLKSGNGHAG